MLILIAVLLVVVIALPLLGWALWMLVSAALVGAVVGGLARLALPGRQDIGLLNTVVLGWIGSLVGSIVGRHLLHVGTVLTVLCEIAVAAALVALMSSGAGSSLTRRRRARV